MNGPDRKPKAPSSPRELALVLVLMIGWAGCAVEPDRGRQPEHDVAALLSLHESVLDAHRRGSLDAWLAIEAESYVVASRGEITFPSKRERRTAREPYLESTSFDTYRDLRDPIVAVSEDGTLGWLIARVEASGFRQSDDGASEPVRFVSAWIELYRKEAGEWRMVGNVSNFRPDPD